MSTKIQRRQCSTCGRNRTLTSYSGERGRVCAVCRKATARASARKTHLAKTYELTQEEYDALLEAQGGGCAICRGKRPYNLPVDHDHALAETHGIRASLRGLLCKRCNKLLRDVRDVDHLLRSACEYLAAPPARKVLK